MIPQDSEEPRKRLRALEAGPVYRFSDWPNAAVPQIATGAYTVWKGREFLYVGMAGTGWTASRIAEMRTAGERRQGLFRRLSRHASGARGGDQFCIYVCDRLILPTLSPDQIQRVGKGEASLDKLTGAFVQEKLTYRFVEVEDSKAARELEKIIRAGALHVGKPLLNPR